MEAALKWRDSWASPYAPTLHLVGDEALLGLLAGSDWPEVIPGVAIEVAKDGNNVWWRLTYGGDWVLVKAPGSLQLEEYPRDRQPVDGMGYLPVHNGERFEGRMWHGKNRSQSVYSVVLTAEGAALTPIDRHKWGDRAYDVTGSDFHIESMVYEVKPEPDTDNVPDGAMAEALRRAGLV